MKKITRLIISCLIVLFASNQSSAALPQSKAPWTHLVYMEASAGGLYTAAFQNINEMITHGPGEENNLFLLLHTEGNSAWFYQLKKNSIELLDTVILGESYVENITHAMNMAVSRGPANHYGLVLWNHGFGILDEHFNENSGEWELEPDGDHAVACPIKRSPNHHMFHRGMLTTGNKTIMSSREMAQVCESISQKTLAGQKIDILGLDMCKGAMLEHAWQIKDYVNFMIGSQECELVDGWPYKLIMEKLAQEQTIAPRDLAQHVIDAYTIYYQKHAKVGTYTQSALDLQYAHALKENIDALANCLRNGLEQHGQMLKDMIYTARKNCLPFCEAPMYADIYQLYENLLQLIEIQNQENGNCPKLAQIKTLLDDGCNIIENMVIANCTGPAVTDAHGISIYFPYQHIDSSYPPSIFAQASDWLGFLEKIIA